jgi:hypothetical protein
MEERFMGGGEKEVLSLQFSVESFGEEKPRRNPRAQVQNRYLGHPQKVESLELKVEKGA